MKLAPTQVQELTRIGELEHFRSDELDFRVDLDPPEIRYRQHEDYCFVIKGTPPDYCPSFCPGDDVLHEQEQNIPWTTELGSPQSRSVLGVFQRWLRNLRRELRVAGELGAEEDRPDWVAGEYPPRYAEAVKEQTQLQDELDECERMGRLLWQTGTPLRSDRSSVDRSGPRQSQPHRGRLPIGSDDPPSA